MPHSNRPNATRHLLRRLHATARRLREPAEADSALQNVRSHQFRLDAEKRWESWRQLILIDRRSQHQLRNLATARTLLERVSRCELSREEEISLQSAFRFLTKDKSGQNPDFSLEETTEQVVATRDKWKDVHALLTSRAPRVLVVHAFLMLSRGTGVEIASLIVGGLVVVGLIYSHTYYQGATDASVLPYFTLDDVLSQGVRGLGFLVAVFVFMEALFWLLRKSDYAWSSIPRLSPVWWFLRHPVWVVVIVAVVTAGLTAVMGDVRGRAKRTNFFDLRPAQEALQAKEPEGLLRRAWSSVKRAPGWVKGRADQPPAELATTLDGTILRDVYLVGTTDRTATFLQVCEWSKPPVKATPALSPCERAEQGSGAGDKRVKSGRVVVLDRALILCHAEGDVCDDMGPRRQTTAEESTAADAGIARLEAGLDGVSRQLESMARSEDVKGVAEEIDKHLNRHHTQLLSRIENLP